MLLIFYDIFYDGGGMGTSNKEAIITPTAELAQCGAVFVGQTTDMCSGQL